MNTYAVKKINLNNIKGGNDYFTEVQKATIKYCNGLQEVWEYCGGRLHRERAGYSGIINNIEYVAVRSK